MSFILSFIMAFTVFGVLGTAQVNAAEDVAFTVTLSTTLDEDVTNDSTIKILDVLKEKGVHSGGTGSARRCDESEVHVLERREKRERI